MTNHHQFQTLIDSDESATNYTAARELLMDRASDLIYDATDAATIRSIADNYEISPATAARLLEYINSLDDLAFRFMLYNFSLCPMHACDYAICFDDEEGECADLRLIAPNHDT